MKKIFAIALALVMVLSMASAFAFVGTCGDYAYTCPTVGCGVAKAKVVQFAADNSADGFVETNCAGVVVGLPVFYGVQVTFDSNVNAQWFADPNTKLEITVSNGTNYYTNVNPVTGIASDTLKSLCDANTTTGNATAASVSGKTFWLAADYDTNGNVRDWYLTEELDCVASVFGATADSTKVKVCANVKYVHNGVGNWDYTDFDAAVSGANDGYQFHIRLSKAGKSLTILVVDGVAKYASFSTGAKGDWYYDDKGTIMVSEDGTYANGKVTGGELGVAAGLECDSIDDYLALIGIKLGDCVTEDTIKAIFGWDDAGLAKHCATWNKDAQAIVNAECVVMGIPKTGDASVLAWLF